MLFVAKRIADFTWAVIHAHNFISCFHTSVLQLDSGVKRAQTTAALLFRARAFVAPPCDGEEQDEGGSASDEGDVERGHLTICLNAQYSGLQKPLMVAGRVIRKTITKMAR